MTARFSFWQRWLFVVALLIALFGALLAIFNQTPAFDFLFNNQINPVFWGVQPVSVEITTFQGWIYGVLGATITGWGILLAFIAYYPFRHRERWAWNAVAWGLGLWFIIDTPISLYFGVYFNVAFNLMVLIVVALPLLFTRKAFIHQN